MACTSSDARTNLLPRVWGKPAWMFLYTVAVGYPNLPTVQDRNAAKSLILSLQYLLPCDKCRVNFKAKMAGDLGARLDDAVACSESFTRYIYDLESAVASTTGGTMPSFEDTRRALMSNTFLRSPIASSASSIPSASFSGTTQGNGTTLALSIVLPIAVVVSITVTWAICRSFYTKK